MINGHKIDVVVLNEASDQTPQPSKFVEQMVKHFRPKPFREVLADAIERSRTQNDRT